jgi:hypothetical protein
MIPVFKWLILAGTGHPKTGPVENSKQELELAIQKPDCNSGTFYK